MHQLPETGFLRLRQIIGNPHADPPIPPLLPISRSALYEGVRMGKYPKPVQLGPRTSAYPVEAIRELLEKLAAEQPADASTAPRANTEMRGSRDDQ